MLMDINDSLASSIPLIIGRYCLATTDAIIKCRSGLMILFYRDLKSEVNIFNNKSLNMLLVVCNIDINIVTLSLSFYLLLDNTPSPSLDSVLDEDFFYFYEKQF